MAKFGPKPKPVAERFLSHVCPEPNTGCWLWTGSWHRFGYGKFGLGSATDGSATIKDAYRVSWQLFKAERCDGLMVCHKCDTPQCVNPEHLFLGTALDNMRDMREKGRAARKLSDVEITEIRRRRAGGETLVSIAKDYGINHTMVSFIARGVVWRHVK